MENLEKNLPENISTKYLTFYLAKEMYGIEILKVREIIGMMDITPVPQTPDFVKGLINLRGKVLAVIDLRTKFGFEETEYKNETCMIIVDLIEKQIGLIIDSVCEVVDIPTSVMEKTPSFGASINTDFIKGIGKIEKQVVILLNIEKVLSSEELLKIESLA